MLIQAEPGHEEDIFEKMGIKGQSSPRRLFYGRDIEKEADTSGSPNTRYSLRRITCRKTDLRDRIKSELQVNTASRFSSS